MDVLKNKINKPNYADGVGQYKKRDGLLKLSTLREKRKVELHENYFKKLREEREKRLKDTVKLNRQIDELNKIKKELQPKQEGSFLGGVRW